MIDIEDEDVIAACAQQFPLVTKRVYKEPEFLKNDGRFDSKHEWIHEWDTTYLYDAHKDNRETADKIMEISTTDVFYRAAKTNGEWIYGYSFKNTSGSRKFRCIGGPLDGQFSTIGTKEYISYNCGENERGGSHKNKKYPTVMLLHINVLK